MFFIDSIARIKEAHTENLSEFLRSRFHDFGVELSWVDFIPTKGALFVHFPDGFISSAIVHEVARNDLDFQRYGAPLYHFAGCKEMMRVAIDRHIMVRYMASLPMENLFSFKTISGRSDIRFFRDKPLEPCRMCSELVGESLDVTSARDVLTLIEREFMELEKAIIEIKSGICDACFMERDSLKLVTSAQKSRLICKECESEK